MNNKIYPCFWFDGQAAAAAKLYIKAFGSGQVTDDSGVAVGFELFGQRFMGLNGGPVFTMNPSISMFVVFKDEAAIEKAWATLVAGGGSSLMELGTYPWAQKYGWLKDKYGLSWQLSLSEHHKLAQRITPLLTFTQGLSGKAGEAIDFYTGVFPNSAKEMAALYEEGEGDTVGYIKHARFSLAGQGFMAMDSSGPHEFVFNEGVSLVIGCKGQGEVDFYWNKLTQGGSESQCGWLKDRYGVSWQVVPSELMQALGNPDPAASKFAMDAMMKMNKIIIADLTAN